jgi:hypothetical protein
MTQPKPKPKAPTQPPAPTLSHQMRHKRLAYACYKCEIPLRIFVTDPSKPPPRCGTHGAMVRQDNRLYFGKRPD